MSGLLSLGVLTYACANGDTVNSSTGNTGGSTGSGTGGNSSGNTGGNNANTGGNNASTGGNNGNTGGTVGSGGTHATGGTTGTGTGGVVATGGTTGSTGGTTGTAGSGGLVCGSSFAVNSTGFVTMPAVGGGCWSGYASDGGDAGSTIMPGSFMTCGMPCMLTMTGTLNASNMANSYAGYSYLGFNIGQSSSATTASAVTPKGSGITVTFTNASASTVRVALNADSTGTTSWCYQVTSSPATIMYGSFVQQCYAGTPGPAYAKQPIVSVQLSVPGAATTGPVNVTLVSVTENP